MCCACGDRSRELKIGAGVERGLAYIGRGKWICSGCTRTANAEFALQYQAELKKQNTPVVESETPPRGFV